MKNQQKIKAVEIAICNAANITHEELRGRSRNREIVDARAAVWFILNKHLGYSYGFIGKLYKRDHTTVLHSVRRAIATNISSVAFNVVKKHSPDSLRRNDKEGPLSVDSWSY